MMECAPEPFRREGVGGIRQRRAWGHSRTLSAPKSSGIPLEFLILLGSALSARTLGISGVGSIPKGLEDILELLHVLLQLGKIQDFSSFPLFRIPPSRGCPKLFEAGAAPGHSQVLECRDEEKEEREVPPNLPSGCGIP